ncbi:hypothetical protein ACFQO7_17915 [Catellatospora aurea]|uniref:Lipoprotein LprG n=1 Tax=Catellatospora aurea TaxID=1337874 RepID=A0ABW2GWS3_9ACTN
MNDLDRLSGSLHELAGQATSAAPTQRLLSRGRRVRHRRTALTGASLAVLTVGAVAAVAAVNQPSGGGVIAESPPASVAAADPGTRLVAAITASQSTSYQLKITLTSTTVPEAAAVVSTGAFDPAARTGYLRTPFGEGPGVGEERLVDGVQYAGSAGVDGVWHWTRRPGTHDSLGGRPLLDGPLGSTADPAELLAALTQAGAVVTQTGPNLLHFEYAAQQPQPPLVSETVTGDVTLDADGRISGVVYDRNAVWQKPGGQPGPAGTHVVVEFSAYGTPVTVAEPTVD